jgi:hypothetical protein
MQDERITRAVELFQAWMLLSNLAELQRRLPPANVPPTGKRPADWNEFRSYALCVELLKLHLSFGLDAAIKGLRDPGSDFQIRSMLLPPSAKFPFHPDAWLERRGKEGLGGEEPER